ncbi:MAG: SDR family NAD(P)-dependent oxidoreductase, partial [Flavobacteriaceae bacterium]
MIHLKHKNAFITGGTKGIGLGIAEALLINGISVAFTGRDQVSVNRTEKALKILADQHNTKVIGLTADVRNYN